MAKSKKAEIAKSKKAESEKYRKKIVSYWAGKTFSATEFGQWFRKNDGNPTMHEAFRALKEDGTIKRITGNRAGTVYRCAKGEKALEELVQQGQEQGDYDDKPVPVSPCMKCLALEGRLMVAEGFANAVVKALSFSPEDTVDIIRTAIPIYLKRSER